MEVQFYDPSHDRLEVERDFTAGWPAAVVDSYRRVLQLLRAAHDPRDLLALRCLGTECLETNPKELYAMRLDGEHRLVVELRGKATATAAWIVAIQANTSSPDRGIRS